MAKQRILALLVLAAGLYHAEARAEADRGRPSRFVAPINQQQLDMRIDELRQQYEPYLRSLPQPLQAHAHDAVPPVAIYIRGQGYAEEGGGAARAGLVWRRV